MEYTKKYWNEYYKNKINSERLPSQFAAFILNEFCNVEQIVEFGCGTGRDSFFFSNYGKKVLALDYSETIIENNIKINNNDNLKFELLDVSSEESITNFQKKYSNLDNVLVYGRFFIHGIDEKSEDNFLNMCDKMIKNGGSIALEFRTNRDENLVKETESHFRRFVNPLFLIKKFNNINFKINYYYEGWGFAKYKNDDAYVARIIAQR